MPGPTNTPRPERVLRQHVDTDRLLGIDAVPMGTSADTPLPQGSTPAPGSAPAPAPGNAPRSPAPDSDKLTILQTLDQQQVQNCTACELHHSRTQTVFGEGDPDADLMIIGEGPGVDEDRLGRPFVGRSGELLDKQIAAMGFKREDIYIANVVKCRPPNNRTPTPAEAETCGRYLQIQIETVRPKAILTLGGPAAKLLLHTTTGITQLRGQWHTYDAVDPPIPVMPTFHPAFLLRQYTQENRANVWNDLQQVMQKLAV